MWQKNKPSSYLDSLPPGGVDNVLNGDRKRCPAFMLGLQIVSLLLALAATAIVATNAEGVGKALDTLTTISILKTLALLVIVKDQSSHDHLVYLIHSA